MAEPHPTNDQLIEEHLTKLRTSLGSHPDAEASIAELRDHLLTAAEHHEASGLTREAAERRAVDELGAADAVGAAYATNRHGRPAVPTNLTKLGGITAWAAIPAIGWAAVAWTIGDRVEAAEGWGSASQLWYTLGSVGVLLATMCLLVTAVAVVTRNGGLGVAGWSAVGIAGLGTFVSVLAWAVPVWATLLAVAWALLAVATRRTGLGPRWAPIALAVGLGAMPLLVVAADTAASDRWAGEGTWATVGPLLGLVAIAAVAAGCAGLGRWLSAETPVDAPHPATAPAT